MTSKALVQCLVRVSVESRVISLRVSDERRAPMNSKAEAMSWLDRVSVPSDNIWAVKDASPDFSGGSVMAPALTTSPKDTTGISCCSTTMSFNPLDSSARSGSGGVKTGSLAGGGMMVRSNWVVLGFSERSGTTLSRT